MPTTTFAIRGAYIQLDQLLKAAGLTGTGGEAHAAVEAGLVRVDGRVEARKRAKLRPGQRVSFGGETVELTGP
jgi:ribosome-associated protein